MERFLPQYNSHPEPAEICKNIAREIKPMIDKILNCLQRKILKSAMCDRYQKVD